MSVLSGIRHHIGLTLLAAAGLSVGWSPAAAAPKIEDVLRPYHAGLRHALPVAPPGPQLAADSLMTRIAFGSCIQQDRSMAFWDTIAAERPQLFMAIGDNVYGDTRWRGQADLPTLRAAYARLAEREEFRGFRSQVPMLATWDDHDFGMNDAGASFAFKGYAETLFERFWHSPAEVTRHPGIYHSAIYGPAGKRVQVILLDTRFFRSELASRPFQDPPPPLGWYVPSPDPDATVLGKDQWSWLERELAKPADVRLIVSSIQVLTDAHGFEKWGNYPAERKRLLALLRQAGNAVLLSGDRHQAGVYHDQESGLWELTSSSLNLSFGSGRPEPDGLRKQGMFSEENYALVDFDWAARTMHLRLRKATDGSPLGSDQSVPMQQQAR